jgi:acyl-CoA synthetase (AMP-forming)/AMP-acid ligase II
VNPYNLDSSLWSRQRRVGNERRARSLPAPLGPTSSSTSWERTGTIFAGLEARITDPEGAPVAFMEPDGEFRIVDCAKDLVKSGGEWISSVELEGHLLAHPQVADAAVVGVPSKRWDERPLAVLVAADPADPPTLESVRAFLTDRVAKWWLPDAIELVDEIPKTSVGKLDKKVIRGKLDVVLD